MMLYYYSSIRWETMKCVNLVWLGIDTTFTFIIVTLERGGGSVASVIFAFSGDQAATGILYTHSAGWKYLKILLKTINFCYSLSIFLSSFLCQGLSRNIKWFESDLNVYLSVCIMDYFDCIPYFMLLFLIIGSGIQKIYNN